MDLEYVTVLRHGPEVDVSPELNSFLSQKAEKQNTWESPQERRLKFESDPLKLLSTRRQSPW